MGSATMICTIAYILGVLSSSRVSFGILLLFVFCVIISSIILALIRKKLKFIIPCAAIILLIGGFRGYFAAENPLLYNFPEKYVSITGSIDSLPAKTLGAYPYRYIMRTENVSYKDQNAKIKSKIIVNTNTPLCYGDRVSVSGFLYDVKGRENEYEYDYSAYYKSKGIYARLTALELSELEESASFSMPYIIGKARELIYNNINTACKGDKAAYYSAVLLDNNSDFSDECKIMLRKSGILNTLYSTYVHLAVMMLLSFIIFKGDKIKLEKCIFFMLIIYTILNTHSPSLIKCGILAAVIIFSKNILGSSDKLQLLSLLVLLLTLIEPLLCFNSGFMMSVISTYLVTVSYEPLYTYLCPFFDRYHLPHNLCKSTVIWFILVFGTLPFSAYYFGAFSPYTIILTPVIIPLIAIIIVLSPVLFLIPNAYAVIPILPDISDFALGCLDNIARFISILPLSYNVVATPRLLHIVIFCLTWWIMLSACRYELHTTKTKAITLTLCVFLFCSLYMQSKSSLELYFVNVGQGDGAVISTNRGETILIDGGGSADYQSGYNIGERVYLPYLISHGFTDIDVAVVSHYHKDHAEGIFATAENLKINTLIMPDTMPENTYRKELEEIAKRKNIKIEYLKQSDEIHFGSGLTLKVLSPDTTQLCGEDENDTSLVISAEYGKFTALFTGDSAVPVTNSYPTQVDILKTSHHGSKTATDEEFVKHTNPDYAVISVGRGNTYNLPNREVIERLENAGTYILRTDQLGDIRFKVNKNGDISYSSLIGSNRRH